MTRKATFSLQEKTLTQLNAKVKRMKKNNPRANKSATVDRAINELLEKLKP